MITKIRKIIAYTTSVLIMLISLGLAKPNFSGDPTTFCPDFNENTAISTNIETNKKD